jgi:transposase-like protein
MTPRLPHSERRRRRELIARVVAERGGVDGVAELFGVSEGTVYQACHERGVRYARRTSRVPVRAMTILATLLNDPAASMSEVARRHLVSPQRVREVVVMARECGIRVRPR